MYTDDIGHMADNKEDLQGLMDISGYAYSEKLMKQMGWTEGKGLGKNEDGMRDFIQPKKKVNTKGIGFNGVDDRWIEHQEAFDSLLSNLNNGSPAAKEDKLIGVEERAFKLGGRVHYSKFLRGKDLSQKKKEDLNAIVVKRKKDVESVQEADTTGQEDLSGLKTHTSSLSYQEYFAQRMKASRHHKGLNEDGDLQSYQQTEETRDEHSKMTSRRKDKRCEKNEHVQDDWTSHADEEVVEAGLPLNRADSEDTYSMCNVNVQAKKKKKKSKHRSNDGGDNQWSESITQQREDRLGGELVPEECSLEEGAPKRQRKLKHADDSEQTLRGATVSQMEFYSKDSVPDRIKKKSKHKSHDGTESQWSETIISPVECSLEVDVPKRAKKLKRTVENSIENSEQALPKTTALQIEFCTEDSVPRVKKKSKHESDHDTMRFETNNEQWDDGNQSSQALVEAPTLSAKHTVEEAAPKRTKKLKCQPCLSTDDTANGSSQMLTSVVSPKEASSEKHQQQMKKKSKHRPANDTVEEDDRETSSKKAAVASPGDRAVKKEVPMLPLQTCFEEEMPKQTTKEPKQKAPEVTNEKSRLKIHTESVEGTTAANIRLDEAFSLATRQFEKVLKQSGKLKRKLNHDPTDEVDEQKGQQDKVQHVNRGTAKATALAANAEALQEDCAPRKSKRKQEERERKDSCTAEEEQKCAQPDVKAKTRKESNRQQEEGIVTKKLKHEPEQNEVPEDETKKNAKQNQTGGSTPKEPNPEQEQSKAKAHIKTEANEKPKQKLTSGKASPKQEKAALNAQTKKELKNQEEGVTPKMSTREQEQTGPEVKTKKVSKQKQMEEVMSNKVIVGQQKNEPKSKAKNVSKQDKNYKQKVTPKMSNPKQELPEPKVETTIESPQKQMEKKTTKKSNLKLEENELNLKAKMVPKQRHVEGTTSSEANPEEQTKVIVKKKTIQTASRVVANKTVQSASKPVAKKTVRTATKPVAEKPSPTASKLVTKKPVPPASKVAAKKSGTTTTKLAAKKPVQTASKLITEMPVQDAHRRLGHRSKHPAGNSADPQYCQYDAGKASRDFIASRKKIAIRNSRAGNAARKHQSNAERPYPWRLDRIKKGMWRPLFKPDVKVVPVDDDTAATMAQWVIDTVEHSGSRITPAKVCHLSKEMFAITLADHIYRQHNASNWMHIPGYGSKSWVEGCVNLLFNRLVARNHKEASESFVPSTANNEKKASSGSIVGSGMKK
ncbi:caldesmon-like isoform X1 [Dermacentor albipictus]|uniref:caldesmon-like isoform X1 n=1 Tax=Dermacentor albipictus TaxID=60249 RepID=UPI0031FCC775